MATKSRRYVDNQGRVVLPSHIREALNLPSGSEVSIDLVGNTEIRIRAKKDRCSVCGESIEGMDHVTIEANGEKHVCYKCNLAASQAFIRRM